MNPPTRDQRIQTVSLLILCLIAGGVALHWLRPVMIPLLIAIFAALILTPPIDWLNRRLRIPRPLIVVLTLVIIFALLAVFGGIITVSVKKLAANSQTYQAQIENILDKIGSLPIFDQVEDKLDGKEPQSLDTEDSSSTKPGNKSLLTRIPVDIIGKTLVSTSNVILDIFSQSLLVLIFIFFLLIGSKTRDKPIGGLWGEIEQRIRRFIITKTILSALTGILVWIVLSLCGVQFAIVFGFLTFLLNYIPSLGSIIAMLLPVPIILTTGLEPMTVVIAIALPAVIQFGIGNVIEPKIMGDSLDLHPVSLLVALIFWGNIWGIVGMLFAAPITAIIKILFERLEVTAPMANLLAGRLDAFRSSEKE